MRGVAAGSAEHGLGEDRPADGAEGAEPREPDGGGAPAEEGVLAGADQLVPLDPVADSDSLI